MGYRNFTYLKYYSKKNMNDKLDMELLQLIFYNFYNIYIL